MTQIPELPMTMLACARIGSPHSVVFAGFSAEALSQRICAANSKYLVTANIGMRGGKSIPRGRQRIAGDQAIRAGQTRL